MNIKCSSSFRRLLGLFIFLPSGYFASQWWCVNLVLTMMWQIHAVSCCFLSAASSALCTSVLGMICCSYGLDIMNPLKPDLQNQLLFLCFNYWLVNTYCHQAARPQGSMQSKTWLCLRSNRTWLCSVLLEYNKCCQVAKTDVCVCV